MKIIFYIGLIFLNVSMCSCPKGLQEIRFGDGGGFTGSVKSYQIKANGCIYLTESFQKEDKKIKTISKSDLKKIERKFSTLSKESLGFNHPGNHYYFIEVDKTRIVWGDPSYPVPAEIKDLFNFLKQFTAN